MLNKKSNGEKIFNTFNIIFMIVLMIITVYPLLHVLFASVSDSNEVLAHRGLLLKPLGFNFAAYKMVFKNPMIVKGYLNTIIIVVFGVSLNILMTSLAAYVLSRKNVLWKKSMMFFVVFTMFFSGGLIPFYFTVKNLHIDDSYLALILPVAINTFNLIIMRTSFEAIPDSLEESAKLDGANHFTILFRIILPLSLPIVAVMVLYYSVGHWNAWFNAMIFIQNRDLYPLQLVLREILIQNDTSVMAAGVGMADQEAIGESIKYAVIVVATLPILCVYPFLQKYFVKGALVGAVKG
ncbi:carbohydrate ABC transporter permease [Clostridium swellfunianum]|uniref:carbohydrate ABC transporter permease n=1 Tax=Clostridium swellfunianum TaxID=1367462 RepID=UPI002030A018|nr:carbohydrate ABC transporter permease [Clostridium swellfunianum]MCM0649606.1 carbohydrate ABC transporter permease [Clostridium swellfunianum]